MAAMKAKKTTRRLSRKLSLVARQIRECLVCPCFMDENMNLGSSSCRVCKAGYEEAKRRSILRLRSGNENRSVRRRRRVDSRS